MKNLILSLLVLVGTLCGTGCRTKTGPNGTFAVRSPEWKLYSDKVPEKSGNRAYFSWGVEKKNKGEK